MEREVKQNYGNGERSTAYNDRHRSWGWNVPATDIDALETTGGLSGNNAFIEFSNHTGERKIYSLMEIKAAPRESIHADYAKLQLELLILLVGQAIPAFGVEWQVDSFENAWYFAVYAANPAAKTALGGDAFCMNERQYIEFQYRLRGMAVPTDVRAHMERLSDEKTPRCFFDNNRYNVYQPPHFMKP